MVCYSKGCSAEPFRYAHSIILYNDNFQVVWNLQKKIAKLCCSLLHAYFGGKKQSNFLIFKIENSKGIMKNIGDYSSISESRLKLVFHKTLFGAYQTFKRKLLIEKNV